MSVRTRRYIFGSWLLDRLMAVLWAYLVLRGFGRRRGSAAKIRHPCGPPPRGFRRVSLQSLREQFDSPPSLKLRRTAFVSTGLPAEAAKQRRLVGGSGIEPLTPSMSRKCLTLLPLCWELLRCEKALIIPQNHVVSNWNHLPEFVSSC